MKRLILFLLICVIAAACIGQKHPPPIDNSSQLKLLRLNEVFSRIMTQKNDPARIQMYLFYSDYFTENNIYPNADAIDLIDAYNKQANYDDIKSNKVAFRPLLLSPVKFETQKLKMVQQNNTPDKLLKIATDAFNTRQEKINGMPDSLVQADFKQVLVTFRNNVLPRINNNSANIPTLQLYFFLTSLNDINHLMDQFADNIDLTTVIKTVRELMDDFFAYNVKPAKVMPPHNVHSSLYQPGSKNVFLTAAYKPADVEMYRPPDESELPNADVYVYTRGTDGKWDQQPKQNAFNVYYGANGLKYSLTTGCDTLSFFKYHPSVPASTLPVILAKGNYCFVLQDVTTNKLYLRPDINLRDNKVIDDQQLIKLCFKVEN